MYTQTMQRLVEDVAKALEEIQGDLAALRESWKCSRDNGDAQACDRVYQRAKELCRLTRKLSRLASWGKLRSVAGYLAHIDLELNCRPPQINSLIDAALCVRELVDRLAPKCVVAGEEPKQSGNNSTSVF